LGPDGAVEMKRPENSSALKGGVPEPHAQPSINRRELLAAVSALVAALALDGRAGALAANGDAPIDIDAFRALTNALTGFSARDESVVQDFLQAFSAEAAELTKLYEIVRETPENQWDAAIAAAGLTPLATGLTTSWYTGMIGKGPDQRVISYLDAFAWYAVGYTKPPSQCDTNFGAWADRPPPGRFSE